MKIAEMKNRIEKMREIYKFDDEKTEIDIGSLGSSMENDLVEVKTVDKNGTQIIMTKRIDKISKDEEIDWTDFYNRRED